MCNIDGIESFPMRSQLRWAGHVVRMQDDRIPKILMYSQLEGGQRNVGRPLLRFKDKLKSNLAAANIAHTDFENAALDRKAWRSATYTGIKSFSAANIIKLRKTREKNKASEGVRATHTLRSHSCPICGLLCNSLAGLKCHFRFKHKVH